jgi:hypothetical protein
MLHLLHSTRHLVHQLMLLTHYGLNFVELVGDLKDLVLDESQRLLMFVVLLQAEKLHLLAFVVEFGQALSHLTLKNVQTLYRIQLFLWNLV